MKNSDLKKLRLIKTDDVILLKNVNTTLGFVRFNNVGEVEYIFVNPMFRKKGLAKKLLQLVKEKTKKKASFSKTDQSVGSKTAKIY